MFNDATIPGWTRVWTGGGLAASGSSVGFSIGEVSQAVGLAPQTLRLWERERLVRPRRTDRGYRVYTEPDVRRLKEIKHLRKVEGLNFAAIRKQLGDAPENGGAHGVPPPGAAGGAGGRRGPARARSLNSPQTPSRSTVSP